MPELIEKESKKARAYVTNFKELDVFIGAMNLAMEIFDCSRGFPKEERYSLTDQIRRSSRSVCGNIAEAWRKRRYKAAFISKLSDAESEACETQVWIEIARRCGYVPADEASRFDQKCDRIISQIVLMIDSAEKWLIRAT
ncbi:MAG: four helix bundle protein [Candidatus Omnitrophica bacterium]|nr:four helix bundle protein [Candidatus Omnitrophota bacterium]